MSKLHFKYGAMGSGKTLELLRTAYAYKERGKTPLLLNPSTNNRDGEGVIASRTGVKENAYIVNKDTNIFQYVFDSIPVDIVLIDEVQFLTKEQVWQLTHIVDLLEIPVIGYGLRTDFKGELFEGSKYMFALADNIEEIESVCWFSKEKAIMNLRVYNGFPVFQGEQIQLGGHGDYFPVSRKVYKQVQRSCEIPS